MAERIHSCRICGNERLVPILDLGEQAMTGVFPRNTSQVVETGPLQLVKCSGDTPESCGLVQLAHSFDLGSMYGDNYGYRSGLNASMARHLQAKVRRILSAAPLGKGDLIVDIGSNDGTTLSAYPQDEYDLLGVDPTGQKFREFYPPGVDLIADFFSEDRVRRHVGPKRARVVSSFSMFYDLESPIGFMREVLQLLEDDGIWVFEQSYMPAMLVANSYDTVCHEHLEYYGLAQIKWMTDRLGAKIIDVEFNEVNGGSFSVTVAKQGAPQQEMSGISGLLERERNDGLSGLAPYRAFEERVARSREVLRAFIDRVKRSGAEVSGLGASTKGNVLLQYCNLTAAEIGSIGEVNEDKIGCFTPGSLIPIVREAELLERRPDYLLVLPWHFRSFFETNPKFTGLKMVYPLPVLTT